MAQNDLDATVLTNYTRILSEMKQNAVDDGEDDDWSRETLQQTRYIIQRIIVPCLVTIGIAGNLLTVIVLTRYSTFFREIDNAFLSNETHKLTYESSKKNVPNQVKTEN